MDPTSLRPEPEKSPPFDATLLKKVAKQVADESVKTVPPHDPSAPTLMDVIRGSVGGGKYAQQFQEEYAKAVKNSGPGKW